MRIFDRCILALFIYILSLEISFKYKFNNFLITFFSHDNFFFTLDNFFLEILIKRNHTWEFI
jgi:hypothetical protein